MSDILQLHCYALGGMDVCNIIRPVRSTIPSDEVQRSKTQAINEGVLALLHDRLYQACQYYIKLGHCPIDGRDNLEYMFRPYKALGGNGTGEELYNRCLALPYEPESEKED